MHWLCGQCTVTLTGTQCIDDGIASDYSSMHACMYCVSVCALYSVTSYRYKEQKQHGCQFIVDADECSFKRNTWFECGKQYLIATSVSIAVK